MAAMLFKVQWSLTFTLFSRLANVLMEEGSLVVFVPCLPPQRVLDVFAMCMQIKAMSWGAILCILMCVANVNSADLDLKSIMSASS